MSTKYIIVCQARTGSTALASALTQHKNIAAHGEVFGGPKFPLNIYGVRNKLQPPVLDHLREFRDRDPIGFWENVIVPETIHAAIGLKFKYEELTMPQWDRLVKHIGKDRSIHIISLKRENLLERELSQYIALNVAKMFNTRDKNYTQKRDPITLDPVMLHEGFKISRKWERQFDKLFRKHPRFEVTYDDIASRGGETLDKVQNFLGVPYQKIAATTKKLQKRHVSESIENFEELKSYFKKTEFAPFFES